MASTLSQLVKRYGDDRRAKADEVTRVEAGRLRDEIIKGWPVDTGASRAAWQGPTKVGHAHYRLRNDIDYATTIEYGGYPGIGPKTHRVGAHVLPGGVEVGGGIFPKQKPAAPVRRAISKRTLPLKDALGRIVKQS